MRLPDFLIIGAMKAGTTTLWADLRRHSAIFMPESKEPEMLGRPRILEPSGRKSYASLFRYALDTQLCGEASTLYSKLPYSDAIAGRALDMLGSSLKLIYMVREPVARARSHHRHLWMRRKAPPEFEDAVGVHPEIIEYGLYGLQIEPWLRRFRRENLMVLRFEDYVADRSRGLASVLDFLGLESSIQVTDDDGLNRGDVPTVLYMPGFNDLLYELRMTLPYKWLSEMGWFNAAKKPLKRLLQRPVPELPPFEPGELMLASMIERYERDLEYFAAQTGRTSPLWNLKSFY